MNALLEHLVLLPPFCSCRILDCFHVILVHCNCKPWACLPQNNDSHNRVALSVTIRAIPGHSVPYHLINFNNHNQTWPTLCPEPCSRGGDRFPGTDSVRDCTCVCNDGYGQTKIWSSHTEWMHEANCVRLAPLWNEGWTCVLSQLQRWPASDAVVQSSGSGWNQTNIRATFAI
jgi:hypothetical protein